VTKNNHHTKQHKKVAKKGGIQLDNVNVPLHRRREVLKQLYHWAETNEDAYRPQTWLRQQGYSYRTVEKWIKDPECLHWWEQARDAIGERRERPFMGTTVIPKVDSILMAYLPEYKETVDYLHKLKKEEATPPISPEEWQRRATEEKERLLNANKVKKT
jgi:hypothetical protein